MASSQALYMFVYSTMAMTFDFTVEEAVHHCMCGFFAFSYMS